MCGRERCKKCVICMFKHVYVLSKFVLLILRGFKEQIISQVIGAGWFVIRLICRHVDDIKRVALKIMNACFLITNLSTPSKCIFVMNYLNDISG